MNIGIYRILNIKDNKCYIGSTTQFPVRCTTHFALLRGNRHHSSRLQKSWNLDGEKFFKYYLLEEVTDVTLLLSREKYWMDYYKSYDPKFGYNISSIPGGFGMLGLILNRETGRFEDAPSKDSPEWEAHIQALKASRVKYQKEHQKEIEAYLKEYVKEHLDEIKEYQQEYRNIHKEEMNDYNEQYYEEHEEELKRRTKERILKIQQGIHQVTPRKQFCKHGHDTNICGRDQWGICIDCNVIRHRKDPTIDSIAIRHKFCPQDHDKDVTGRTKDGRCLECRHIRYELASQGG